MFKCGHVCVMCICTPCFVYVLRPEAKGESIAPWRRFDSTFRVAGFVAFGPRCGCAGAWVRRGQKAQSNILLARQQPLGGFLFFSSDVYTNVRGVCPLSTEEAEIRYPRTSCSLAPFLGKETLSRQSEQLPPGCVWISLQWRRCLSKDTSGTLTGLASHHFLASLESGGDGRIDLTRDCACRRCLGDTLSWC